MDCLNEEEQKQFAELFQLPTAKFETFLDNVANYDSEPEEEKQRYYDILLKISLIHHKSKLSQKYIESLVQQKDSQIEEKMNLLHKFLNNSSSLLLGTDKRFKNLEWRLQANVLSRSCREVSNLNTKILINMDVKEADNLQLEISPTNLNHIISKLEQALHNSKNISKK